MSKKRPESAPKYEFREITRDDVLPIKIIHNSSFPILYDNDFYEQLFKNPHRHTILATIASSNAQGYEVVGALTYRIKKRTLSAQRLTEYWNGFTNGSHAYIMTLAVAPDHRRKGIAKLLLDKMLQQLRDCDISQVSLHMLSTNDAALRLYSSFGFTIICRISDYYIIDKQAEEAYWLRKDLTKPSQISEAPIIASRIRAGPWPFGMTFENFFMLVFALLTLLLLLLISRWRKS